MTATANASVPVWMAPARRAGGCGISRVLEQSDPLTSQDFRPVPRLARFGLLALTLLLPATAPADREPASPQSPVRGLAARLQAGRQASEVWTFIGRFDGGYALLAELTITNLGPGEQTAAVIGHMIEGDGSAHRFRKARRRGRWTATEDGLRIEIGRIVFDQRALDPEDPRARLTVDRKRSKLQLDFALPLAPASVFETADGAAGLEIGRLSAPAAGSFWREGFAEPVALRGRLALSHRWSSESEAARETWRIEAVDPDLGMGLWLTAPGPDSQPTLLGLVIDHDTPAPIPVAGITVRRRIDRSPAGDRIGPERIEISGPGLSASLESDEPFLHYEPFEELAAPLRWLVGLELSIRAAWSTAPMTLRRDGNETRPPLERNGTALVAVTRFAPGLLGARRGSALGGPERRPPRAGFAQRRVLEASPIAIDRNSKGTPHPATKGGTRPP